MRAQPARREAGYPGAEIHDVHIGPEFNLPENGMGYLLDIPDPLADFLITFRLVCEETPFFHGFR
jgi:hypothetical protein